jgi:hypothetical protein
MQLPEKYKENMTFRAKGPFPLIKAYFHSRKISTDRKFSENDKMSLLKVENFQLQNFFPTENLCRPITFYKFFFPRKFFLSGNGR